MRNLVAGSLLLALSLAACSGGEETDEPGAGTTPPPADAPALDQLSELTILGLRDLPESLVLQDGRWEEEPADDRASRASVAMDPAFHLVGDLDGDGSDEAYVLMATAFGGTGHFGYVAAAVPGDEGPVARTFWPLGDRVQIRNGSIEGDRLVLEMVEHGPGDAACCPRLLTVREATWDGTGFRELPRTEEGELSIAAITGTEWILDAWGYDEPVDPSLPEITLRVEDGAFVGQAACNRYRAPVADSVSDLEVGIGTTTRRACPEPVATAEERFLRTLDGVTRFSFAGGRLVLTGLVEGALRTLYFTRRG